MYRYSILAGLTLLLSRPTLAYSGLGNIKGLAQLIWLGIGVTVLILIFILVPWLVLTLKSQHKVWQRGVHLRTYTLLSTLLVIYMSMCTVAIMYLGGETPYYPNPYLIFLVLVVLAISLLTRKHLVKVNAL